MNLEKRGSTDSTSNAGKKIQLVTGSRLHLQYMASMVLAFAVL
jgi:hypothetical protein